MTIDLRAVVSGAATLWRREQAVLAPVAGMFLVLPTMLRTLLMTAPDPLPAGQDADMAMLVDIMSRNAAANAHWLIAEALLLLLGSGMILALFLDHEQPTVSQAIGRALRRLPALLLAQIACSFAAVVGLFLFLLPGFYVIGRTFMVPAVLMAESRRGFLDGIVRGVSLTRGCGFALFGLQAMLFLAGQVGISIGGALAAAGGASPIVGVAAAGIIGLAAGGVSLAYALLRVSAYRLLTAPSRG